MSTLLFLFSVMFLVLNYDHSRCIKTPVSLFSWFVVVYRIQTFDSSLYEVSVSPEALKSFFTHSLTQTLTYNPQLTGEKQKNSPYAITLILKTLFLFNSINVFIKFIIKNGFWSCGIINKSCNLNLIGCPQYQTPSPYRTNGSLQEAVTCWPRFSRR